MRRPDPKRWRASGWVTIGELLFGLGARETTIGEMLFGPSEQEPMLRIPPDAEIIVSGARERAAALAALQREALEGLRPPETERSTPPSPPASGPSRPSRRPEAPPSSSARVLPRGASRRGHAAAPALTGRAVENQDSTSGEE